MANAEWLEIFRGYSDEELRQRVEALKADVSVYSAQSIGSKSFTRDLAELKAQLSSAMRVMKERGLIGNGRLNVGLRYDFSGMRPGGTVY